MNKLIVCLIVGLFAVFVSSSESAENPGLVALAAQINRTLPKMVRANVRRDSIYIKNGNVNYNETILTPALTKTDFLARALLMKQMLVEKACTDPKARVFLKQGRSMVYNFHNSDSDFIGTISIDSVDCTSNLNKPAANYLVSIVNSANKYLPGMVSKNLRFDSTETDDKNLILNFTLTNVILNSNKVLNFRKSSLFLPLAKIICDTPQFRKSINSGYGLNLAFYDDTARYLGQAIMNKNDCN